jgi:hypothetical protein
MPDKEDETKSFLNENQDIIFILFCFAWILMVGFCVLPFFGIDTPFSKGIDLFRDFKK